MGMIGVHWTDLPDQLPIHFNAKGKVDGYGDRSSIIVLPILSLILVGLLYWIIKQLKINPHRQGVKTQTQLELTKNMVRQFALLLALLFGWINYAVMAISVNKMNGLGKWFLLITFVCLLTPLILYWIKLWRLNEK